jgi:hypothetical protein
MALFQLASTLYSDSLFRKLLVSEFLLGISENGLCLISVLQTKPSSAASVIYREKQNILRGP